MTRKETDLHFALINPSFIESDERVVVRSATELRLGERYVAADEQGWVGVVTIEEDVPEAFHCYDCETQRRWGRWVVRSRSGPPERDTLLVGPTSASWPNARILPTPEDSVFHLLTARRETATQIDLDGDGAPDVEARVRGCPGGEGISEIRMRDGRGTWHVTERHLLNPGYKWSDL